MGIGGEYAAIHSAIDELIPARFRGRVDLAVSGTYWFGAIIASLSEYILLNKDLLPENWGWRVGFFINVHLGLAMIVAAPRYLPETAPEPGQADVAGALSSTLGMTALV